VTIAPGQTLEQICQTGCSIALKESGEEAFTGDEVVFIEDGFLVTTE